MELRQSTSQVIRFGPFVDSTDGVTPETTLTIAQADMKISKDGAAFAQKNAAGNATHDVDGYYFTTLDTTDSNTTAILKFEVTVAGALLVWENFQVVTQTYYDAKYAGTFNNLGGTAQTADHTAAIADMPTNSEFNARTISSASYGTITNQTTINSNVLLIPTTPMRGTDGANTTTPPTTAQIWAETTRVLTSGANIVLAKGVGVTGFNDIAATDIVTGGAIATSSGNASVDVVKINGTTVIGAGNSGDLWRA